MHTAEWRAIIIVVTFSFECKWGTRAHTYTLHARSSVWRYIKPSPFLLLVSNTRHGLSVSREQSVAPFDSWSFAQPSAVRSAAFATKTHGYWCAARLAAVGDDFLSALDLMSFRIAIHRKHFTRRPQWMAQRAHTHTCHQTRPLKKTHLPTEKMKKSALSVWRFIGPTAFSHGKHRKPVKHTRAMITSDIAEKTNIFGVCAHARCGNSNSVQFRHGLFAYKRRSAQSPGKRGGQFNTDFHICSSASSLIRFFVCLFVCMFGMPQA